MADKLALARSARKKLQQGNAVCMANAIRKAINGAGIFHEPDIKRLMKEVGSVIAQEDGESRRRHASDKRRSDSLMRSRLWRKVRPFLFTPESGSQYLSDLVREYLRGMAWVPPDEFTGVVEAVTHIIRQRMAKKAAATRRRNKRHIDQATEAKRQYELF